VFESGDKSILYAGARHSFMIINHNQWTREVWNGGIVEAG